MKSEASGWIAFDGGNCPVNDDVLVEVKFRHMVRRRNLTGPPKPAYTWVWRHSKNKKYSGGDIIAYRALAKEGQ